MSRSIHTTHRHLEEVHRSVYHDRDRKREEIRRLRDSLEQKRTIKERVLEERQLPPAHDGVGKPEGIPIHVVDQGNYVHYPAGVEDLKALMARLPRGVTDGISGIVLGLGTGIQADCADDWESPQADPWIGRLGVELLPGVFVGFVLGQRDMADARIWLYAHVYDPADSRIQDWKFFLRLWSLSTFIHEVAHHFDHTQRGARGRWFAANSDKAEDFARYIQYAWTQQYVLPYLAETYPEELEAAQRWLEHYGGTRLPLHLLYTKILPVFNMQDAVDQLAREIASGASLTACRLLFANELHYCQTYQPALDVLQGVLADDPSNDEAMTLRADIFIHQERFEEAAAIANNLLAKSPSDVETLIILADAYEGLKQFDRVLELTERIMDAADKHYQWCGAVEQRVSVFLALGRKSDAEQEILRLEAEGPRTAQRVERLRKKLADSQSS